MNAPYQTKDFYGRDFLITKDTLIPRPETEQLIDLVLTLAGKPYLPGVKAPKRILPEHPTILDVGTGSGCIAITIKKELPEATVYATDISEPALKVAQKNASILDASITTIISHLLEKVNSSYQNCCPRVVGSERQINLPFTHAPSAVNIPIPDLIVANLPYVDPDWDWLDKKALSQEPSIALYADDHGLALIKQLIDQASARQVPRLILEADPCEHPLIKEYIKNKNYNLEKINGYIILLKYKKWVGIHFQLIFHYFFAKLSFPKKV